MELHTTFFLFSVLLFHSIRVSFSEPSHTPPVLIPRLETWARAMQLSFRSISEPPSQSQFQSQSSGMVFRETSEPEAESEPESVLPRPVLQLSNAPSINLLDSNISTILERTMKSTAGFIKLGSIHAQRLSDSPGNPKNEAKSLRSCKDSYDNALNNFQEAMKALSAKDLERMNSMLNAVLSDVEDCRDEYFGKPSPLASYDDKVIKMTSSCLAIVDMVHEHH